MAQYVIAHYHEVALKGKNRPFFIERLVAGIRRALAASGLRRVVPVDSSLLVELEDGVAWETARAGLEKVFGLSNFARVERCPLELEAIRAAVRRAVEGRSFRSFRMSARRSDKRFPLTSEQLNRELGAFVQTLTGAAVSLKAPELTLYVDILAREALVYTDKTPGPGGLPVGSSGQVVVLLSGGIDSPVAAYRVMRRGCRVSFVHFHSYPFLDASSKQKAQELVEVLDAYQGDSRLYLVPFGEAQREVVLAAPEPFRTLVYRRLMLRIASRVARLEGAGALVTGESLGQVASQTLENMAVVERAAELLVLRPLVGMDKLEIIRQAEQVGTYPISIVPDQDCCQLFMPRHPATRATEAELLDAEARLDMDQLARLCLREVEVVQFSRGGKHREVRDVEAEISRMGEQPTGSADRRPPTADHRGRSDGTKEAADDVAQAGAEGAR